MNKHELDEIIACLPDERTLFRYFKDRYALMLLDHFVGDGKTIADIRKSGFSVLLDKPVVKSVLAWAGNGCLTHNLIADYWKEEMHHFVLTVDRWGCSRHDYDQTSRDGYNLVLQLNFSNEHDGVYKKLVKPEYEQLLNSYSHPILDWSVRPFKRETLAWARIDLDFSMNEALIEEVQSDWVRQAKELEQDVIRYKAATGKMPEWYGANGSIDNIMHYCRHVIQPYQKIWDEAVLSAAIDFIRNELGVGAIYFHSADTGSQVKHIRYAKPPRSLYSHLPKRFCFKQTDTAPGFLLKDKKFNRRYRKVKNPEWFVLEK
ncbi:MAG: hypothetical protein OEZ39_08965 [Gammaproteobacteria bacterium]|nr:hypothetical protein [Gammaproteobacteria bacterium]MDH5651995.1 hypothetical protein [Gammaproteobacteria bacterium]